MHRRQFIIASAALLSFPRRLFAGETEARPYSPIASAANDKNSSHIGLWSKDHWQFSQVIKHRGHDSCYHRQRNEILFFSRRPGREMYIVDASSGDLKQLISSEPGYHYYGHGCLSADGSRLYTSENHFGNEGAGSIGVYDCNNDFRCLGHLDCEGIGPHELALMPDGKTLVIAIGGIKTLPESGRKTLNPDTLAPALHYLDLASASVAERHSAPHFQISLRHLDVSHSGSVIIGAQFQGQTPSHQPLVFQHRRGNTLSALQFGDVPVQQLKQDYIASVSIDHAGHFAVSSCPRDNIVCLWDLQTRQLEQLWSLRDCAGAVYDHAYQQFILSTGDGQLMALKPGQAKLSRLAYAPELHWDNHLSLLV
jgi:hypothetical protein